MGATLFEVSSKSGNLCGKEAPRSHSSPKTHGFRDHSKEAEELLRLLGGDLASIPACWGGNPDDDAWWREWCDEKLRQATEARSAIINDEDSYYWWQDFV